MKSTTTHATSELHRKLESAPITQTLGGKVLTLDPQTGTLVMQYEIGAPFLNPAGQVQGGILGSMLDDVTALLIVATLEPGAFCSTLGLNVSFLLPGKPGTLIGKSSFERQGKNVSHVRGEIWQGDTLIATAAAVCMVRRAS